MKKILFLFILLNQILYSQNIDDVLNKTQKYASKNDYKVNLKYSLYKGENSQKVLENYTGLYIKKGDIFYNRINNTETLYSKDFLIKVNHDQKAILFTKFKTKRKFDNLIDITTLLKQFENEKLTSLGETWKIEMIAKEYSPSPYGKIELWIDKKTFQIKKQVVILTALTDFSNSENEPLDINLPRIEISYSVYTKPTKLDDILLKINQYVKIDGKKVTPSVQLKKYEIIEQQL